MGLSNVTHNIGKRVANYRGEREEKLAQIQRIEQLVTALPQLRERLGKLDELIAASQLMMREHNPDWSADNVAPRRRNHHDSPIPFGDGSRIMLEILRTTTRPLKTREIAEEMLARVGVFNADRETREKVQSSVDAALREREGLVVTSDGSFPRRWWVLGNQNAESAALAALEIVSNESAIEKVSDSQARKLLGLKKN